MNRCDCAKPFQIVDGLNLIQQERERLKKMVASKEFKRNKNWQWMLGWLKKTDEQHLQDKMRVSNWTTEYEDLEFDKEQDYIDTDYCCALCFKAQRYLLVTNFSFCQEYGCGMRICKDCAIELGEIAKGIKAEV